MANWERGAKYGLSGAATGAGIGSLAGPIGTAIGGGLGLLSGGLYGLFSDEPEEFVADPNAGTRVTEDPEIRRRNLALADLIERRVRGEAPSAAEGQLRKGMEAQVAAANALAASGAGASNPGLAQRQAMLSGQRAMGDFNADAAILRAQEQAAAEGRLAALLGVEQQAALGVSGLNEGARRFERGLEYDQAAAAQKADRARLAGGFETGGELLNLNRGGGGGGMDLSGGYVNPNPMVWHGGKRVPADSIAWADGGIAAEPTVKLIGEAGPEAVVPLTSPADAALAATMIDRARMRMDAEQKARALGMLATRLTGGGKVHRAPAARLDDAAMRGGAMGALAARLTEGR